MLGQTADALETLGSLVGIAEAMGSNPVQA